MKNPQTDSGLIDWDYKDLRSVALSVSSEAASIGRRFTFISLLCNGIGTALLLISIDFPACHLASPTLLYSSHHAAPWLLQVLPFFGVAVPLFKHGDVFNSREMPKPYSIAVTQLKVKNEI